ncbi:MAG: 4Fe-4S binding protein [Dehalococcoidia bacterium]|jgi:NADH-quinone oxidoreductase subunit I|nr:4Fe-4S binding protein [Chloroflexota bacterium]MCK4242976.1 4Fe-4S binding protein [Dehalococcoidia bacterium]
MLATITVNDEKCNDPLSCRKCLLVCPTYVLGLGTSAGAHKFKEIEPEHFIVRGVRFDKCTGCMKCAEVCPKNAVQVSF